MGIWSPEVCSSQSSAIFCRRLYLRHYRLFHLRVRGTALGDIARVFGRDGELGAGDLYRAKQKIIADWRRRSMADRPMGCG